MADVFFGEIKADIFGDSGIIIERGALSPEYAVRIGAAVAAAVKSGRVGVMSSESAICRLTREGLLYGICSAGVHGVDLSPDFCGFASMAAFAAVRLGLDAALCVYEDEAKIKIDIFDRCGLYPERSFERKTASVLAGGMAKQGIPTETERLSGLDFIYRSELAREAGILGKFAVTLNDNEPAQLFASAISDAGGEVIQEAPLRFVISDTGFDITAYEKTKDGEYKADAWHIAAVIEQAALNFGIHNLALPLHAPAQLEKIATDGGITVAYYTSCPYDSSERETRAAAANQLWLRDSLFAAARLCALLSHDGHTLESCVSGLPPFDSLSEDYTFNGKPPRMTDIGIPAEEGVIIDYEAGRVRVIPRRNGGFRLFVDTVNAETASEIMSMTKKHLDEIMSDN